MLTPCRECPWQAPYFAARSQTQPKIEIGRGPPLWVSYRLARQMRASKVRAWAWNTQMLLQHHAQVELIGHDLANHRSVGTNPHPVRINAGQLRIGSKRPTDLVQEPRQDWIICVDDADDIVTGKRQTSIDGARLPAIGMRHNTHRIAKGGQDGCRRIRRTIIKHEIFETRVVLLQHAFDGRREVTGTIVDWREDGDRR